MKHRIFMISLLAIFILLPTSLFSQSNKITIIKIAGDRFAINQGSKQDIKINTYYFIIQKNKSIGRAKVINIHENISALQIISLNPKSKISIGDELILDTTFDSEAEDLLRQHESNLFNSNLPLNKNPYSIHKKISGYGLFSSWIITALGSGIMGDQMFGTTVIPVVGPFVTMQRIENDPNGTYLPGGKGLLTVSGIVQSSFAVYYIYSLISYSNWKPHSRFSITPMMNYHGILISYNF
ncbi:MAG: hypothetical protein GF353_05765 [Candidatus Lokiarchaeota archaeon]|nr:hypothetical protein [Candidatus Lokiarchaeota archaeon]